MREKLNENPLVQVALLGVLALIVGFVFFTRMGGESATEPVADPVPTNPATGAPVDTPGTAPGTASDTTAPVTPATPATPATPSDGATPPPADADANDPLGFNAGPGLPEPVVKAYDAGQVVVLLIVNKDSIDDEKLEAVVRGIGKRSDTQLFLVEAKDISDYSRIAQGVDVNRTPAIVVLQPKNQANGGLPVATIEYGFRGPDSVQQTVEDALYKGPDDLPYYP